MRSCTNDELSEGINLFPEDLEDAAAIVVRVDPDDKAVHIHQGGDCLTVVASLYVAFIKKLATIGVAIELARGLEDYDE